jgi:hypothetical protein
VVNDGDEVFYSGYERAGALVGDHGQVLASSGSAAHVKWSTGARAGSVSLEHQDDLEPRRATRSLLADSLEYGELQVAAARSRYDEAGPQGVLSMLAEDGHLMAFAEIAEEALAMVAYRVRHDPSVRAATASLDDDEGEQVVRAASAALIYDAFSLE